MKTNGTSNGPGERLVPMTANQCVWVSTGVGNLKALHNACDCRSSAFDEAIGSGLAASQTALAGWREAMRKKPYFQKQCTHMLTGRVQFKLCAHNYDCNDCPYDQFLYEEDLSAQYAAVQANGVEWLN